MSAARRVAASKVAVGGAGVFHSRYTPITDGAMPAVPPPQEVLRAQVNLQQNPETGRSLLRDGPVDYERIGNVGNHQFNIRVGALEEMRETVLDTDSLVEGVRHLPPGYRLNPFTYPLTGLAIGEIVAAISTNLGSISLRGLYLDADVLDLNTVLKHRSAHEVQHGHAAYYFNKSVSNFTTQRLPLWLVRPVLPRSIEYPHGFLGGTLAERMEGTDVSLRLINNDPLLMDAMDIDIEGDDSDLLDASGSDLSSYYILANARLVRRVRAPEYINTRVRTIRTGGFSELLTETVSVAITLDEVVEVYIANEGVTMESFAPEYVTEFKRCVGKLFTNEVFTDESKTLTLIIPGGARRHMCCVDTFCFEFLTRAIGPQSAAEREREILSRFEHLYVESCCTKRVTRKRARPSTSSPSTSTVSPPQQQYTPPTPEERKALVERMRRDTRWGYTSSSFKLFQTAFHCVTGYLPCIYYHRVEKAKDYNNGVRVRMIQVGAGSAGGGMGKILGTSNYKPLCMMRINIEGEIHRHKPQSLCAEEGVAFIVDDDTSGMLHSIGVYPSLPEDFFKGINVKKREAFLEVVESKTKAVMNRVRRAAVGLADISTEMMEQSVKVQLTRQEAGLTNTLIYTAPTDEEATTPKKDYTHFNTASDGHGRKIPQRTLVIAYDLETVELTPEAVTAGAVGPEFLKKVGDPVDRLKYIECERQIPFCVSWVPVNLSDEGRHKQKKREVDSKERKEEEWCGRWSNTDTYVFCEGGRRVREGYVLLDEVRVHYGGHVLGRCVQEFFESIMQWAMERGYTSIAAYAHNGVGFDSYVIQAFNTQYEYKSILKTSRGLLSMKMKMPFTTSTSERKSFMVTFLDTKVFLSFSLSKLCKDFKVPVEWSKLDFPITKITWQNCYHPDILTILEPYSINDSKALAYIIKQINRIVCLETSLVHSPGNDELPQEVHAQVLQKLASMATETAANEKYLALLHPPSPVSEKPPIVQFCTIMSCVKKVAKTYMEALCYPLRDSRELSKQPYACDVPLVRHWIDMASMGGRVSPYSKMYCSSRWKDILEEYMGRGDKAEISSHIRQAIAERDTAVVLDVTSLYPSAMAYCPMPMGALRYLDFAGCIASINAIDCPDCEKVMTICPIHRETCRPFVIVVVQGGLRKTSSWNEQNASHPLRHQVGRKLCGKKERGGMDIPGRDVGGLIYSNEDDSDMTRRHWGSGTAVVGDSVLGCTQSYTNVDLYWAWKAGYEFNIIGGYEWETSYELQPLILTLFKMRLAAKATGNTCLQQSIKLLLNGFFGVHSQRVIHSVDKVVTLPAAIREADVLEEAFAKFIRTDERRLFDPRMRLTENIPMANGQSLVRGVIPADLGEAVGGYSPNHIGCAVLAWSRHIMSLAMFSMPAGHLHYTDTDSLAISETMYQHMVEVGEYGARQFQIPPLVSPQGEHLLTYKNDHSDYFRHARVLFSAIGAKKVKLHVIGCPESGELKICSTFKGLLKKDTLENGDRLHEDHFEHTMAQGLLDILYIGKPRTYEGTRWGKSLGVDGGVKIDHSIVVQGESYTYLGKHRAFAIANLEKSNGTVILNIPFGVELADPTFLTSVIQGVSYPSLDVITPLPILQEGKRVSDFISPHLFEYLMPEGWIGKVEKAMGGVTKEAMYDFLNKYFDKRETLYVPTPSATTGQVLASLLTDTMPTSYLSSSGGVSTGPLPNLIPPLTSTSPVAWDDMLNIFANVEGEEDDLALPAWPDWWDDTSACSEWEGDTCDV